MVNKHITESCIDTADIEFLYLGERDLSIEKGYKRYDYTLTENYQETFRYFGERIPPISEKGYHQESAIE